MSRILAFLFCLLSFTTFAQSSTVGLSEVVRNYKNAINDLDSEQFQNLFFSKSVPFVGVFSEETLSAAKDEIPNLRAVAVSNSKDFFNKIIDAKKEQKIKYFNVKKHSDGMVASMAFDYAIFNGEPLNQWGHQKWNLVKSRGEWLITDVVYSIQYPSVESCPFVENYTADEIAIAPSSAKKPKKTAPIVRAPKKREPAKKIKEVEIEEEDYTNDEYEEEGEEEIVQEKPAPTKSKFTVKVNGRKKAALITGVRNKVDVSYGNHDPRKITMFMKVKDVDYLKNEDGSYIIKPTKSMESFPVSFRVGGKTISYDFKVENIPAPRVMLGRRNPGNMNAKAFRAEPGLLAVSDHPAVKDGKCRILEFRVVRESKSKGPQSKINKGSRFQPGTLPIIKAAKKGDTYTFANIKCQCAGDKGIRKLEDVRFDLN